MPFKKADAPATPKVTVETVDNGQQALHEAAVKSVASQHGPRAQRSPHYDELVEDAKRQISQAIEANKSF